jgi:4-amino-4-deoxy-L-arabinose transferase-like glycosyltransferase
MTAADVQARLARGWPTWLGLLGVLVVLAAATFADGYVRHGYTVSWYARTTDGERIETARTTEHRVVISNDHRPMSRIVEGWNYRRLGIPADVPPIDATLRASITVPREGRYFRITSSGSGTVRVDGSVVTMQTLVPGGVHHLEVDWHTTLDASAYFQLEWGPEPVATERVPREALVPADGALPPLRRALWIAALVLGAIAFVVLRRIASSEGVARRKLVHASLVAMLVMTGVGFRLIDYDVMPDWRDNDDERFACWNGFSLIEEGRPRALTIWPAEYVGMVDMQIVPYFGRIFHVISPYFEHPPLMHLLVGAAGVIGGAHEYREVRLSHARLVPIALAGITIAFLIALGRRLDRRSAAPYVGALLYAVLPWIVIQTRVIKEEDLMTTLSVACIYFFVRWRDEKKQRDLTIAAILAGACALAKVPGAAFVLVLAVLVMREAGARTMMRTVATSLPVVALWPIFGAIYGWRVFAYTQNIQAQRQVHFNSFLRFFDDGMINHTMIGRGWLMFLWLATLGAMLRRSRAMIAIVGTPLVAYLAAITLGSGDWTYGWYITPLFPWLCLGAGAFIVDAWNETDIVRGAILTFVFLFYTLNFAFSPEWIRSWLFHMEVRWLVTIVLLLGWGPFALSTAMPSVQTKWFARIALVGIVTAVVIQSALFVYRWDELSSLFGDFDRNRHFDR